MTDNACSRCIRRHLVAGHLECRARPPVADPVSGLGRWPRVGPSDFCHSDFEADAQVKPAVDAPRARRARPEAEQVAELPL